MFTFSYVEHCRPFADCELSKASEPPTHPKTQRHHARCTCGAGADTGANRDTGMDCLAMTCIVMNCVLSHLKHTSPNDIFPCRKNGNTHGGGGGAR